MKMNLTILAAALVFIFTLTNFAQSNSLQISGGRFFIKGGSVEEPNNAVLQSEVFSATSFLGGQYSPWFDICLLTPTECSFGKSFTVPRYEQVSLGGCVGDCYQFVNGTFTINGVTYENAYYRGNFVFSRETFFIPKTAKRKGTMYFQRPFSLTGNLEVCQETNIDRNCPPLKVLFSGAVNGHGTLTVKMNIKISENLRPFPFSYLQQESFEYRFEQ